MRYVIWRCPGCKKVKFTRKADTRGSGRNNLQCNACNRSYSIKYVSLKVFSEDEYADAVVYYKEKK